MANPAVAEKLRQVDSYDCLSWQVKGLYALTAFSLLLAACGVDQKTSAPLPGVTEAIPTPPAEVIPVPVEEPPIAIGLTATSTQTVLTGAGGGRPPLCDPLLAPFIPGEEATQDPDGVWIDSQGNPLRGADVDGILLAMSGLAGDEFKLHVQTAGFDEGFRWWVQSLDGNGRPGWNGSSEDSFLDRPDSLPEGAELTINLLPHPGIAGEIKLGISDGEVTAAVIRDGLAAQCFNPVTNEWFIPDSGPAGAETPRPADTSTPALSTPRSGVDPLGELLTERVDDDRATPEPPPPTATAKPTVVVQSSPEPSPVPPSPTPEQPMSPELQRLVAAGWPTTTTINGTFVTVEVVTPIPGLNPKTIAVSDCRNPSEGYCNLRDELNQKDYANVEEAIAEAKKFAPDANIVLRYNGDLNYPEEKNYVGSITVVIKP